MKNKVENVSNKTFWSVLLPLVAFLLVLSQPQRVSAQWTAPDAGGNINSTNTGSVVIGTNTTAPLKGKLEVRSDTGVNAGEHGLFYVSRGGQGTGGVFMGYRANGTAATGGYLRSISNLPLFVGTTAVPEAMTITDNGNVGVGASAPEASLHVSTSSIAVGSRGIIDEQTSADANGSLLILRKSRAGAAVQNGDFIGNLYASAFDGTAFTSGARMRFFVDGPVAAGSVPTGMQFLTGINNGSNIERMRITSAGNIGIGTAAPVSALHVVGDITVTGNINAKYQDVAEWVPTLYAMPAGTVVVLDIEHNNHVTTTTSPYDTRVAGVISAQPGISLGEAGEGKALVATTGRVKVKVDATRGAIRVGDLLVTSETPGVAMRSQPLELGGVPIHRPGTLIGKALEPLDKGTGEILVLLSLQ